MRILTPKNFKKVVSKMLLKKQRWNDTLDNELCDSVLSNVNTPMFTAGIPVHNRVVTVDGTSYNLTVLYNPYMVMSRGCAVAVCVTNIFHQIAIFVDDDYMNMTNNTQEFIIHHEIGHIVHSHTARICRNIDYEYEADMYAAQHNIHGIEALQEIGNYVCRKSKKEINRRINHLRKEVM